MSCGLLSHALPVGVLELLAGDGVLGGPCVGLGTFGVLAAPPADRLQLSRQARSPVAARRVARARVP